MNGPDAAGVLLVVAALVVAGVAPALALPGASGPAGLAGVDAAGPPASDPGEVDPAGVDAPTGADGVGVGQQLATVVAAESETVKGAVDREGFEAAFERANDSERAELLADRADTLADRAAAIREAFREATEAFREGDLDESAYAQRIAILNARAEDLLDSVEQFRDRTEAVPAIELRAAGVNRSAVREVVGELEAVTGTGPRALLARFTGERVGDLAIDTGNDSLSITVGSDGEHSRELERDRDGDDAITVAQSTALSTARGALSNVSGRWALVESAVDTDEGAYTFAFDLRSAEHAGEAEVSVDGSTGAVFSLEESVEPVEEGDDSDEVELSLVVADGTPGPGETVTIRVLADGDPVEGATVGVGESVAGTTDADGTVRLTLPPEGGTVAATYRDAEAELEFEFGDEDPVFRSLSVDATYDDGSVNLTVTYDGTPLSGATVSADGDPVGTTDADGTVAFETAATEELEVEITLGEFEAEYRYAVRDGSLVPVETPLGEVGPDDDDSDDEDSDEDDPDEREDDDSDDEDSDGDDSDDEDEDPDDDDSDADDPENDDSDADDSDEDDPEDGED